jgi:recombination protein RecT
MNAIVERKEQPPLVKLASQLEQRAIEFKKALPSHISPEKLQRTVMTAVQNNPDLLTADRQTLITSCMKAAQDGLLPDGREAALVIFSTRFKDASGQWSSKKQVQYMPMVYGLRKKIVQSGEIVSLQTGLVYKAELENGAFLYEVGLEPPIRHRPMLDLPAEELTDDKIIAAYSMAKMKDGTVSVEVMRRGEIDRVREVSQTGATKDRYGKPRESKGPWADWFGEMARKTVMRRHSKTLPMSGDLIVDIEGREMEAAASTVDLLDVEPDAPIALPRADELGEQAQQQVIDHETGEVTGEPARDEQTGMTEVDEETARALDAAQTYQDLDGPLDIAVAEPDDQPEQVDPKKAKLAEIEKMAANAKTIKEARKADAEWWNHRVVFDEATQKTMDAVMGRMLQKFSENEK